MKHGYILGFKRDVRNESESIEHVYENIHGQKFVESLSRDDFYLLSSQEDSSKKFLHIKFIYSNNIYIN